MPSVFRANSARTRVGFKCFLSVSFPSELGKDLLSMFFVSFDTFFEAFWAESLRILGHNFAYVLFIFVVLGTFSSVLNSY